MVAVEQVANLVLSMPEKVANDGVEAVPEEQQDEEPAQLVSKPQQDGDLDPGDRMAVGEPELLRFFVRWTPHQLLDAVAGPPPELEVPVRDNVRALLFQLPRKQPVDDAVSLVLEEIRPIQAIVITLELTQQIVS